MAKTDIRLDLYDIENLGLYGENGQVYLTPENLLKELKYWCFDSMRPLVETATYEGTRSCMTAYCLGFYESNGDYILGLWNEVPVSKKGFGSVAMDSSPRDTKVTHTKISSKSIPGYPTYFYISPSNKSIATIRFGGRITGLMAFRNYIRSYIRNYSSHVIDLMDGQKRIRGLCEKPRTMDLQNDNRVPNKKVVPLVLFKLAHDAIEKKDLILKAREIKKIVKELSTTDLVSDSNASLLEKTFRFINKLPISKRTVSRFYIPVDLTSMHVEQMFKEYEENDGAQEYNVGFIYKGESKIQWMSGVAKSIEFKDDILYDAEDQPNLVSLMSAIKKHGMKAIEQPKENTSSESNFSR